MKMFDRPIITTNDNRTAMRVGPAEVRTLEQARQLADYIVLKAMNLPLPEKNANDGHHSGRSNRRPALPA
jgi:hypothetical protein